jgi:hypothetical protein
LKYKYLNCKNGRELKEAAITGAAEEIKVVS